MRNIFFPLFLVLVLLGFNASAIKKIQGKVIGNGAGIANATVSNLSGSRSAATNRAGEYTIILDDSDQELRFQAPGYLSKRLSIGTKSILNVKLIIDPSAAKKLAKEEIARNKAKNMIRIRGIAIKDPGMRTLEGDPSADIAAYNVITTGSPGVMVSEARTILSKPAVSRMQIRRIERNEFRSASNTESYKPIQENGFIAPNKTPLSTFSIDVDAAAYSNVRRYLNNGALPPKDAVRIEEMVNYFNYDYPQPGGNDPVNIGTEIAAAPWNPQHKLVKISLQARRINTASLPAANLVFLIDVSGSMAESNKLPLLISSFKLLTDQLRPNDHVAIVVYAGRTELVLPSTPGSAKTTIKDTLDKLMAGGGTAGGKGLEMAYKVAAENFIKKGNNRIILATDGDFNVGASSDQEMERLIEEKRKSGIFLTVLGYGMGNIKDSKMETLADKGNGNYAYIDNISEARKVLINEFGGTLFTVAKDVKLQVEFNPSKVQAYRLIGYENRLLADEDFNNDRKDAGDMGAGHTVTAFYEVIPFGVKSGFTPFIDPLKYQKYEVIASNNGSPEMLMVKLRYKQPDGHQSKLLQKAVLDTNSPFDKASEHFRFAAAVAEFGLLLRQSEYKRDANYEQVIRMAQAAKGKDTEGYRAEFINLVKSAALLAKDLLSIENTNKFNEKN
ncbi:von Willebrand factor type A domain-containing protein [Pedobacter gandavensis]|uniref:YfbK domain-containing protein n=1 Tax=Pedobacter gandavensis TaxID=2679963 RepID=UPI002478CBA3|nr:von Willebrand factor type A domain-containing protein [Pedobacter gandavensis]WGQ08039.1 von Willebrand factor type A domain-containing protein [Pedobacter gandavensis]